VPAPRSSPINRQRSLLPSGSVTLVCDVSESIIVVNDLVRSAANRTQLEDSALNLHAVVTFAVAIPINCQPVQARELEQMAEEYARLKKLVAELSFDTRDEQPIHIKLILLLLVQATNY
jgi:hypothetical protein